jgi:hypothetical protein
MPRPHSESRPFDQGSPLQDDRVQGNRFGLADALANPASRIEKFRRDGWARPWPTGAATFAYMISHDAYHRGQVWLSLSNLACWQ